MVKELEIPEGARRVISHSGKQIGFTGAALSFSQKHGESVLSRLPSIEEKHDVAECCSTGKPLFFFKDHAGRVIDTI